MPELRNLLIETKYDAKKTEFLIEGFSKGFKIEYHGPKNVKMRLRNLRLNGVGNKTILWNKIMKEVKLKRYAGPFQQIPFETYIQSLIGLVPKDNGKNVRLIFHLSHPQKDGTSVNANTPRDKCSVSYPDFSRAIELFLLAGKNCGISKSDFSAAFRNLGIRRSDWKYLVMMAESPIDGKTYFFMDKSLPFGASISCSHFQAFSNAISHIIEFKSKMGNVNYLDDFLFVALLWSLCNVQLDLFLEICRKINFPVSIEKTFRASSQTIFLGFLIDSVHQIILVPVEKIEKAQKLVESVLNRKSKKLTLKELQ